MGDGEHPGQREDTAKAINEAGRMRDGVEVLGIRLQSWAFTPNTICGV